MADVKRYGEVRYFLPHEGWRYGIGELPKGDYVDYEDYASLRASHSELLAIGRENIRDRIEVCRCSDCDFCDYTDKIMAAIAKAEGV